MRYIIILLISLFIFFGCTKKKESTIRLAAVQWIGYAPLFVADAKGWLPSNVKLVEFPSNYDILEAIKSIDLEAAALTLDEVIRIRSNDHKNFMVIGVIDYSSGADAIVADPAINSVSQLKGKRVAYEPKSIQEFMLHRALELSGMDMSDITPVLVQYDTVLQMRRKDAFDAAVTFEPVKSRLIQSDMHTIFDSSQIPYEIIDVLAVDEALIDSHPKTLSALLKAYFKGVRYIKEDPKANELLAHIFHATPDQIETMLKGVKILDCKENLDYFQSKAARTAAIIARHLKRTGIVEEPDIDLFEPTFVEEICR